MLIHTIGVNNEDARFALFFSFFFLQKTWQALHNVYMSWVSKWTTLGIKRGAEHFEDGLRTTEKTFSVDELKTLNLGFVVGIG